MSSRGSICPAPTASFADGRRPGMPCVFMCSPPPSSICSGADAKRSVALVLQPSTLGSPLHALMPPACCFSSTAPSLTRVTVTRPAASALAAMFDGPFDGGAVAPNAPGSPSTAAVPSSIQRIRTLSAPHGAMSTLGAAAVAWPRQAAAPMVSSRSMLVQ